LRNDHAVPIEVRGFTSKLSSVVVTSTSVLPFIIEPGTEKSFDVCVRSDVEREGSFELLATLNCFDDGIDTFAFNVEKAYLSTTDAVFGLVPANGSGRKTVEIQNPGTSPLLIDSIDRRKIDAETFFDIDAPTLPTFPVQIAPQGKIAFDVVFTPNSDTTEQRTTIRVYSNAVSTDSVIVCTARGSWTVDVDGQGDANSVKQIAVRPNPVSYSSSLTVYAPANATLNIVDIHGRTVSTIAPSQTGVVIVHPNAHNMIPGTYFIHTTADKQQFVAKILVIP
jgi:hypothetical protein